MYISIISEFLLAVVFWLIPSA